MIPRIALLASLLVVPRLAASQADDAGADRESTIIESVHRSGAAQRCWNAYLQATPDAGSVRLRLRLDVGADGALRRVTFLEPAPTALASCVRRELHHVAIPAGAAAIVETTYSFSAGVPAPVPAPH